VTLFVPQEALRAPALLTPGKKPTQRLKIDSAHPFSAGLIVSTVFQDMNARNMVNGRKWYLRSVFDSPPVANVNKRFGLDSRDADTFRWASIDIGAGDGSVWAAGENWTLLAGVKTSASQANSFYYVACTGAFSNNNLLIYGQRGANFFAGDGTAGSRAITGEAREGSEYAKMPFVMRSISGDANTLFYGQGLRADSSVAPIGVGSAQDTIYLMARDSLGGLYQQGTCEYFHLWNRALSDQDCQSILRDPYQFLMPA